LQHVASARVLSEPHTAALRRLTHGAADASAVANINASGDLRHLNLEDVPKYVISLDTASGRRRLDLMAQSIESKISMKNLCAVKAIDASACADQIPSCHICGPPGPMAPAVGLSHVKALKLAEALGDDLDVVMIIEDDGFGEFPDYLDDLVQAALNTRNQWDLFRLYYVPAVWNEASSGNQPPGVDFMALTRSDWHMLDKSRCADITQYSTGLYLATKQGARLLRQGYNATTMAADSYAWFSNFNELRIKCYNHPVMNFANVPSQHWLVNLKSSSSHVTIPFCPENNQYRDSCNW
jgi:hypothetical protein